VNNLSEEDMPLDREILEAALIGFECRRAALKERIAEVQSRIAGRVPAKTATDAVEALPQRRIRSAATRRRMAAAQRKRWAAARELRRAVEASGTAKGRLHQKAPMKVPAKTASKRSGTR
jgi:hypothetical protein